MLLIKVWAIDVPLPDVAFGTLVALSTVQWKFASASVAESSISVDAPEQIVLFSATTEGNGFTVTIRFAGLPEQKFDTGVIL